MRATLRRLVRGLLDARSIKTDFSDDDTLAEIGITSTDMVALLLAMEGEFDIEVPPDDMTPDVFRSISSIEALLQRMLRVPDGA